jgi:serine O-acetyltransferase
LDHAVSSAAAVEESIPPGVVEALCAANSRLLQAGAANDARPALPSREVLAGVVADLRAVLFPWHFGGPEAASGPLPAYVARTLARSLGRLEHQVNLGLAFGPDRDRRRPGTGTARDIVRRFAASLPRVRALLETDAWAAFHGDPAASSPDEAVFCYPGMAAVLHHRLAHELYAQDVPLVPRLIAELAHQTTGIDIHPGARIGSGFFVDHGTGVVIGETCLIGDRVRLYQGVTLGARTFPLDERGQPIKGVARHPIVEDDVVIYSGATILGRIRIGRGSTIGGNVWVTHSLPPQSHVTQARGRHDTFEGGGGI